MELKLKTEELYDVVKRFHDKEELPEPVSPIQHPYLLPKLRPYQMRAVKWMLFRETSPALKNCFLKFPKIEMNEEETCSEQHPVTEKFPTGGILADEMGLGKTVEVLACILSNPCGSLLLPEEDVTCEHGNKDLEAGLSEQHKERLHHAQQLIIFKDLKKRNVDRDEWSLAARLFEKQREKRAKASRKRPRPKKQKQILEPSSKSITKQAAEAWYLSKLAEVSQNPIRAYKESMEKNREVDIQCICGKLDENDTIMCKGCSRIQHKQCIGASRWYKRNDIFCPQCWLQQNPINSKATLIVSPNSISGQWLTEIKNHISKDAELKVLVYKGVKHNGFSQPYEYASYDVIITTYEVLRSELDISEIHESRRLRYEKRYFTPTCSLLFVHFWRVCLDEAQMVEGARKAAEMVSRISTVHRWAVTGTPIQKSINDLFGLVMFLRIEPYGDIDSWRDCIYNPFCEGNALPLHSLMTNIMWRVSKKDVLEEIQIPPQTESTWWLNFSPIEQHFYLRTHQECANDFLKKLSKFESLDWTLDTLKNVTVNYILAPLLKLRQACSHPQAVRGNLLTAQRSTMTMSELLESLIKKTILEGQEALRKHIASLCGMAAIHIICNEFVSAADKYRSVLHISEEYKNRFKVDTLQMLHTLHNLSDILKHHRDVIPPTLRDDQLNDQEVELENSYLNKAQNLVTVAEEALSPLTAAVNEAEEIFFNEKNDNWWSELSMWLSVSDGEEVLRRVHDVLLDNCRSIPGAASRSIINRVTTHRGVRNELTYWIQNLDTNRDKLLKCMSLLQNADRERLVDEAVDCHLRLSNIKNNRKKLCQLCQCDGFLMKYESSIFDVKKKNTENTMVGEVLLLGRTEQGSWKQSEQERIMRILLSLGKQKKADPLMLKAGTLFVKLLEALRKEFKTLRLLWTRLNERTCAKDELNMCKLRLRLRHPDEPAPSKIPLNKRKLESKHLISSFDTKMENIHIIEPHEVESINTSLQTESAIAMSDLRKKSGTVVYLQNLRSQGNASDTNCNSEVCPVCQASLQNQWAVLSCGHCYCMDCIPQLMGKNQTQCAVCRERTTHSDISIVSLNQENPCDDTFSSMKLPSVKGSHSTKVEAIISRIFYLKAIDPLVKILIFSTWDRVLNVLEEALHQNGICRVRLKTGTNFQMILEQFKSFTSEDPVTVLLLPFKLGSKGLNLTEATHVMLVEPVLNPADELQAIGRVHRIGQTRSTVVHRFLVKGTVEERIFSATKATAINGNKISLRQLRDLFTISVFQNPTGENNLDENSSSSIPQSAGTQASAERPSSRPFGPSASAAHLLYENSLQVTENMDTSENL